MELYLISTIVFAVVVSVMFAVAFFRYTKIRPTKRFRSEQAWLAREWLDGRTRSSEREKVKKTEEAILMAKRDKFLNIPNITFHYANRSVLESFYTDYFMEPHIENLVRELIDEETAGIESGLPKILSSKLEGKNLQKWVQNIKLPELSLNQKFLRYQRMLIEKKQVEYGFDEVSISLEELTKYDQAVAKIQEDFNVNFDDSLKESHRSAIKQRVANRLLDNLQAISGLVLLEGKYLIEGDGDNYKLTYRHQISDLLGDQTVSITLKVIKQSIENDVKINYQSSVGQSIPIFVFGKVWSPLDTGADKWEIIVTPLAIY